MSTRGNIGIQKADGNVLFVYHHSDSYPSYLGRMLLDHYNSREKAEALVALGDLSFVDKRLAPDEGEDHHFDYGRRAPGVTVAYGRDRGEDNVSPRTASNVPAILEQEHAYCWVNDPNGGDSYWLYVNTMTPLANVLDTTPRSN